MKAPAVLALAAALALPAAAPARAEPPQVLATIGVIADMAATLAGDCATVTALIGPGTDPHTYRARPSDVAAFDRADLILYLGLGLEGQLAQVLDRFGARKPTLAVGNAIPADRLIAAHGGTDPHVWMSPAVWAGAIPAVAGALSAAAPGCAAAIAANADRHATELAALDAWGRAAMATIPEGARTLVTAHDAFAYMARDWGLAVAAIQGITTESEASVADIAATARLVAEAKVPAVFVESTVNPRTIEAVIEAAAALGHRVTVGATLHADALGDAGTPEGTYIGMIRWNAVAIAGALGGSAPPLPAELAGWAAAWSLR